MPQKKVVCLNRFKAEEAATAGTTEKGELLTVSHERADSLVSVRLCAPVNSGSPGILAHRPDEGGTLFFLHHKGGGNYDVLSEEGVVLNADNIRGRTSAENFAASDPSPPADE